MRPVVREQELGIGRQPEIVALLLDPLDRCTARRTPGPIGRQGQLVFVEEGLVADRVPPRVLGKIDVAGLLHAAPDRLRGRVVARLGRAHALGDARLKQLGHRLELGGRPIGQRLWVYAELGSRLLHLLSMLVHTGREMNVETVDRPKAGDRVRGDQLVGVADVRRPVGVGNCRRDREGRPIGHDTRGARRIGSGRRRFRLAPAGDLVSHTAQRDKAGPVKMPSVPRSPSR